MIKIIEKGIVINVRVIPNSSKNCILKEESGIKIKITASPVDNKANIALVEFLSKELSVAKSNIEILRGNTSKDKTVLIKVTEPKSQKLVTEVLKDNKTII